MNSQIVPNDNSKKNHEWNWRHVKIIQNCDSSKKSSIKLNFGEINLFRWNFEKICTTFFVRRQLEYNKKIHLKH